MKILYVPHWLKTALKGRGAGMKIYTDIAGLLSIVSAEDVGFYLYLNMNVRKLVPAGIVDTFETHAYDLFDQLNRIGDNKSIEVMRSWPQYDIDYKSRPIENADHVLTSDLGDEATIIFTHVKPDHQILTEVGYNPLLWLYSRVIRQYHPFVDFETLADTPLFLEYLRTKSLMPEEGSDNLKNAPKVDPEVSQPQAA
jgi:hypothetical protein